MKRIYLFPITAHDQKEVNPYMNSLSEALKAHFDVVNAEDPPRNGIMNIARYLQRIDIVYLNWIEEIPRRKLGVLQSIFFLLLLHYFRWSRIKIVWTLHNKRSHWKKRSLISRMLHRQMRIKSDLIITHAEEGKSIIGDHTCAAFIHHPIRQIDYGKPSPEIPESDILIWGSITPYKGIDSFLEFLYQNGVLDQYRIIVAGKVTSDDLREKFQWLKSRSDNLVLMDEFLPEKKIFSLIRRSKLIVFTYHAASVLSSGVLMDSLSQSPCIIGPHTGAFKDLAELGLIDTFEDYPRLLQIIDGHMRTSADFSEQQERIDRFIQENTWEQFSVRIYNLIEKQLFNH